MITITSQPTSQVVHLGLTASFIVAADHSNVLANLFFQWYKNDKVMQGETNNILTLTNVAVEDSDVYSCVVSDDLDTDMVKTDYAALASSLLDYIELNMKIKMLGMTITGGYNFDWKTVNQPDEALGDFPRAVIASPQENCIDEMIGQDTQSYANNVLFLVQVKGSQAWNSNANFMIRSNLRLALDDLKRLFGQDTSINGTCEVVMYRGSQVININQNDIQRPSHMNTSWTVRYAQDRLEPLVVSSS
jgi:hypothetical protein